MTTRFPPEHNLHAIQVVSVDVDILTGRKEALVVLTNKEGAVLARTTLGGWSETSNTLLRDMLESLERDASRAMGGTPEAEDDDDGVDLTGGTQITPGGRFGVPGRPPLGEGG